jgi:hypothetical protein
MITKAIPANGWVSPRGESTQTNPLETGTFRFTQTACLALRESGKKGILAGGAVFTRAGREIAGANFRKGEFLG